MRKFAVAAISVSAVAGMGTVSPSSAAASTQSSKAPMVRAIKSSLGCSKGDNQFAFYVENNSTKSFKVYYYATRPFEQGYDESKWHGRSAYIRLVEVLESPTAYGQTTSVKVVVKQAGKSYTSQIKASRPSRKACGL